MKDKVPGNNPLVSIVVTTYNSAKYVLETLESCKNQTYENIELVITDDASDDQTVKICEEWLSKNKERFSGVKIVRAETNSGISPNLNRGVHAAKGEWVKTVAGDDILLPNCVADYIDFIHETDDDAKLLASRVISFRVDEHGNRIETRDSPNDVVFNRSLTPRDQYELTLRTVSVSVISIFFLRSSFLEIGGCDERFPMYEDKPLLINYLRSGTKYYYLNKFTFMRRMHSESITGKSGLIVSSWKINSFYPVHFEYVYNDLKLFEKAAFRYEYYVHLLLFRLKFKKNITYHNIFSKLLRVPSVLLEKLSKKLIINKVKKG